MSVNKEMPHVLVLPEDDADRELAKGFCLDPSLALKQRRIQVLNEVGGGGDVLNSFKSDHMRDMERFPKRHMVLLIDFDDTRDSDGKLKKLVGAKSAIPSHLIERVFVLGPLDEPEDLKRALGCSYEKIGIKLAKDCREGTHTTWSHAHLQHNASELDRLREHVRPFLFD